MRRIAIASVLIALLPASVYAQEAQQGPPTNRTDHEMKSDAAIDKAYQQTVKRLKETGQKTKSDPWETVRPAARDDTKR